MPLWNELEGTRIADRYPLKTLLRSEGRTAWFETERPEGGRAVISLAEAMNDEPVLLSRLEAASRLKHPNLIAIFDTGSAMVPDPQAGTPHAEGDTPVVYGVMEPFDEGLADVLRDRPLTADETHEILESLLPALEAVHAAGLVHGRVEPASVLAAGETIKLRSDCLHTSGDEAARHEDVRGLAATLYQALTQRKPTGNVDTSRLPAPFAAIVRNGLTGQWTLLDVRRAIKGPAVETAAPAGVRPGTTTAGTGASAGPAAQPRAEAERKPVAPLAGAPAVETAAKAGPAAAAGAGTGASAAAAGAATGTAAGAAKGAGMAEASRANQEAADRAAADRGATRTGKQDGAHCAGEAHRAGSSGGGGAAVQTAVGGDRGGSDRSAHHTVGDLWAAPWKWWAGEDGCAGGTSGGNGGSGRHQCAASGGGGRVHGRAGRGAGPAGAAFRTARQAYSDHASGRRQWAARRQPQGRLEARRCGT